MVFIDCDVLVIGAGVIGLATAANLAREGRRVILLDKENHVGSLASSRNSEVIHSGIYYDEGSLKSKMCIRGKHLLFDYLKKRSVPHSKCGKIIFCNDPKQEEKLAKLYQNAQQREIVTRYCDQKKLMKINEITDAKIAIEVFDTGIFDSHSYFQCLLYDIEHNSGVVSLNTNVISLEKINQIMHTRCEQNFEKFTVRSKRVLNTSGAGALHFLKDQFPIKYESYENFFVKGHYFTYRKRAKIDTLFYPMPNALGLGVHLTTDLAGRLRFGPDAIPVSNAYDFSQSVADDKFHDSICENFPLVSKDDIAFSYAGVRPKLKVKEKIFNDFMFCSDYGRSLISALGIESPGLTSSLAIAEHLCKMSEY